MDFSAIAAMAAGHAEARAIQTAVRLGLFDALASGARDADTLAREIGCEPRATAILADALVSLRLLEKDASKYSLSDGAKRYLVAASPESLGGMILFDAALWDEWGRLDDVIRSGRPARDPDMFQNDAAATERFIRAMDSLVRARGDAGWTAAHLNLSRTRSIVDMGGGPGTYVVEFLRAYPELRGEIWDLPGTLEVARQILNERAADVIDRIELHQFDYHHDSPPNRVDAVFLSNIIHSENERDNLGLMHTCYRALNPGGFIAIKDHIMDDAMTTPAAGAVFSLYLLLTTHGRDYSFNEISRWLAQAGFKTPEIILLPSPPFSSSIVTAVRP
jgi:SAM-dependent methyltransferase